MKQVILALGLLLSSLTPAQAADTYTQTRYPIVLVHGVMGWDSLLGLIEHMYRIPYELQRSGAKVYVPTVAFLNSNEYRADQLVRYLSALEDYKFNLFAHSQGAPTSRWAATVIPERIASITSIHGVNKGSFFADTFVKAVPQGTVRGGVIDALGKTLGYLATLLDAGNSDDLTCLTTGRCSQDSMAAAYTMTTDEMIRQNSLLGWQGLDPDGCGTGSEDLWIYGHRIKAFSWGGTDPTTTDFKWYDIFRPNMVLNEAEDAFLSLTASFSSRPSDGLTDICSQKFGRVIRIDYPLNHFDAVNHIFGETGSINVPSLYRAQANRLRNMGL
ncbi:alpha/beta fold hydrolase [Hahella sp. SMD15-11]|uniref:Alpha/beta fold hydrolase n=1 Tax=Thermohahella caldifontis TaxID=3142973 RepID=A0AB39UYX8_9GAMM